MDKVGRPRRLIAFDTLANLAANAEGKSGRYRLVRPRTLIYAALLAIVMVVMTVAMVTRSSLEPSAAMQRCSDILRRQSECLPQVVQDHSSGALHRQDRGERADRDCR
jgi:hypothetical protein